jgi:hypothetical protein
VGTGNGPGHSGHASGKEYNQGEVVGVDPSIAPGLKRPVGWRVLLGDGSKAWDKTGTADTAWTLVGTGGGGVATINGNGNAAQTITGADGIKVSSAAGTTTVDQQLLAEWPVGVMRVYAIDGAAGVDGHKGFADPASNSLANFQAACVAAGAVAVKTFAGLAAIFPRIGNGRQVTILIASGTYVGGLDTFLAGCVGYVDGCPLVRATSTQATAGAVAFSGSDADRTFVGGVNATGMNAAGYNPTGAATTTALPCTKVGGGAPGFTASSLSIPVGLRIRFSSTTGTVALQNQCVSVSEISAVDTLIPLLPFNAVPTAADVFFLEQPGIICDSFGLDGENQANPPLLVGTPTGAQIVGIACNGTVTVSAGMATFAFCTATNLSTGSGVNAPSESVAVQAAPFYNDPFSSWFTGGGMRAAIIQLFGGNFRNQFSLVATTRLDVLVASGLNFLDGCITPRLTLEKSPLGPDVGSTIGADVDIGASSPIVQPPIIQGTGGLRINGSTAVVGRLKIQGTGANPAIAIKGNAQLAITGQITGSVGNTDVGLDLMNANGALIVLLASPTVTGLLGDVRLAGGQIMNWGQVINGMVDPNGNRIINTGNGVPLATLKFSGTLLGGAGAAFSYLADAGPGLAANNTLPLGYFSPQRLFCRLFVNIISNTMANGTTLTLYKNGVATALAVSVGAGATGQFRDNAHTIFYNDNDQYDLRADVGAADVGHLMNISGTLQYAS